ncbi:predicted protein, partial [Nematostella vectensis]
TILMNSLVIVIIWRSSPLQTNTNILLASLAVTDLMVGCIAQPLFITREYFHLNGVPDCNIGMAYSCIQFLAGGASIAHIIPITLERYIAIKYPMKSSLWITKKRLKIVIMASWLLAIYIFALTIVGFKAELKAGKLVRDISAFTVMLVTSIVVTLCYFNIFRISSHHKRCLFVLARTVRSNEDKKRWIRENKAAKTTAIIIGMFFFSYLLPFAFVVLVNTHPDPNESSLVYALLTLSQTLALIISPANPVIY